MFHLQKIIHQMSTGELGIPEFQRDFDWSDSDVRSLLVTVFSGWPAGSLLLLDGRQPLFHLRAFEGGPETVSEPSYAVLDGQQRLTSLFHALRDKGRTRYAVKWNLAKEEDLDDAIVSYNLKEWLSSFATADQQLRHKLIPLSVLNSPSDFFNWRDDLIQVAEVGVREELKSILTDLYTYRLSKIHDYEFPAVILERDTEPTAIARIFERVNRTGLRLGPFDLMVAKSFDPGWNLRDRWLEVQQHYPRISYFLEDDGMPLLHAMALISEGDVRQSAVLEMTKKTVQRTWESIAAATDAAIDFLTERCGVLRRDLMPYPNMLPPLIALAHEGKVHGSPRLIEQWFWYAGFTSMYNAAANTRLVSHYAQLMRNERPRLGRDPETVNLLGATRQGDRSVWASVVCYLSTRIREDAKALEFLKSINSEVDVGSYFSKGEMLDTGDDFFEERSALNAILVPRRVISLTRRLPSTQTLDYFRLLESEEFLRAQLPSGFEGLPYQLANQRAEALSQFLNNLDIPTSVVEEISGFLVIN